MNLLVYIDKGGFITYLLILMNVVGFAIMIYKYIEIKKAKLSLDYMAYEIKSKAKIQAEHPLYLSFVITECDTYINGLDRFLNIIKNIATISPLLGLLGTVVGVLQSFESIAIFGMGNPTFFSSGISVALITTIAGLIVAIPHYIGYNYFVKLLDTLELELKNKVLQ